MSETKSYCAIVSQENRLEWCNQPRLSSVATIRDNLCDPHLRRNPTRELPGHHGGYLDFGGLVAVVTHSLSTTTSIHHHRAIMRLRYDHRRVYGYTPTHINRPRIHPAGIHTRAHTHIRTRTHARTHVQVYTSHYNATETG